MSICDRIEQDPRTSEQRALTNIARAGDEINKQMS